MASETVILEPTRSSKHISNLKVFRKPIRLATIVLCFLAIVVPVLAYYNNRESNNKLQEIAHSLTTETLPSDFTGVWVHGVVTTVDVPNCQLKIRFQVDPAINGQIVQSIPTNVSIEFDASRTVSFPPNLRMQSQDVILPLAVCDTNKYPFDHYETDESYVRAVSGTNPVRVGVSLSGAIQGFQIDPTLVETREPTPVVAMSITAKRSYTTLFFSLFVIILMWFVTFGACLLTLAFCFLDFVEPPIMIIMTALLFALPNIRNSQPGIPSIGCTADVVSFFFNMAIVSICEVTLMTKFFLVKLAKARDNFIKEKHHNASSA